MVINLSVVQRYPGIVELFKRLAENKRYGPIDRLARALSSEMVRVALYEALRIGVTEGWSIPSDAEVDGFLAEVEKNLGIAQKIAVIALTSAPKQVSMG
ncbi:MAG: hypothetical protein QXJ22_07105 [Ignisphaera sp.]